MKGSSELPDKVSVPINYEIVILWVKDKKEEVAHAEIEYTLLSPEGMELLKTVQDMEIPTNIKRFRSRMKIAGMPITKEGDYSFKITIKEPGENSFKLASEIPLEVKIKRENPQANKN